MTNKVAFHNNSCHPHKVILIKRLVCVQCILHKFTIQGVDQGSSINNIINLDHFIIGQDELYIHNLPTSREALFHSMLNKDLPFIVQCTIHMLDGLKLAKNTYCFFNMQINSSIIQCTYNADQVPITIHSFKCNAAMQFIACLYYLLQSCAVSGLQKHASCFYLVLVWKRDHVFQFFFLQASRARMFSSDSSKARAQGLS